jgi:hypothetical protein
MVITRRVMAILAGALALSACALLGTPASAARSDDDRLREIGLDAKVVQLVADGDSTCALTENGEVFCWGAGGTPDPYRPSRSPLTLVTAGALLVAGGVALVLVGRSRALATPPPPPSPPRGTDPPPA